jgi:CO dehydrogenase maturation factor
MLMKILLTLGRGGTGKTTFVALMTKCFLDQDIKPLLLVDVDPDQNLAEMVGVDLEAAGKKTISELLVKTFLEEGGTRVGIPPSERIENRIWEQGLYEGTDFDLLSVGTKWVEGCYCLPDAALKNALSSILKTYRYVLIDSPAGLEHLNRRITAQIDEAFDIIGPSKKSFDHVRRACRIASEVKIRIGTFSLVGGSRFVDDLEPLAREVPHTRYLGRIAFDPLVEKFVIEGRSLLDIPLDSPGYVSVQKILERASYI